MLAIAVDCSLTIAGIHAVVCSFAIAGIPAVVCCLAIAGIHDVAGAQHWLSSLLLLLLLMLPGDVANFSSSAVATCSGWCGRPRTVAVSLLFMLSPLILVFPLVVMYSLSFRQLFSNMSEQQPSNYQLQNLKKKIAH
jgi:hypothetical protein